MQKNQFPDDSCLMLRKIIMDVKEKYGERFSVTPTRNWRNVIELWTKNKHKKHASAVANHLPV